MFKRFADFTLIAALAGFYWIYSRLWIVEHRNKPKDIGASRHVYAHWHGDELLLVGSFAQSRMAVMVSRSRDGERMKRLLEWFGYHVVRGSSSRGGVGGLKGLIDAVNDGGLNASLAVDGPRGPIYQVKSGVLKLAQQTGIPLIPGAASARRRIIFKKAWNQCYLPLPFSKCVIVYGEPVTVPPNLSDNDFEALRLKIEAQLVSLKVEAESVFDHSLSGLQERVGKATKSPMSLKNL